MRFYVIFALVLLVAGAAITWLLLPDHGAITGHMMIATGLGFVGTFALSAGLFALMRYSHRMGHDEASDEAARHVRARRQRHDEDESSKRDP
ncbi:MAG: hypothetical protein ACFB3T_01045 [Geminicoccaceae bacterium]